MDREDDQMACDRGEAGLKIPAILTLCLAVAVYGAAATGAAAASAAEGQSASGNMILVEGGPREVPQGQSAGRAPESKDDATPTQPSGREGHDLNHPGPSWEIPAPGCPYVDRPLNLIV